MFVSGNKFKLGPGLQAKKKSIKKPCSHGSAFQNHVQQLLMLVKEHSFKTIGIIRGDGAG
jgi:1-aminocyclopropane-1-carboxylate deaminase